MTNYTVQAALAEDRPFLARVAACVAGMGGGNPLGWAFEHGWQLAVQPGWAEAAEEGSEGITDSMILTAVQELYVPPERQPDQSEDPA